MTTFRFVLWMMRNPTVLVRSIRLAAWRVFDAYIDYIVEVTLESKGYPVASDAFGAN